MKKKNPLLIVIIVLLVILILGGGVFAYIYFATDLLKTDKELFTKYALTLLDEENGFIPSVLNEYENKKQTSAYQNNGSFSVNNDLLIDTSTNTFLQEFKNAIDIANNANINFNGTIDNPNRRVEENITINYSDTVNLPFKYKQDGDLYGIQADILSPNYIAIENNNLQDLCSKLGMLNVSGIPNKIEATTMESLQFTDEEITNILNNYIVPVYNNLPEEKFSKNETSNEVIEYTLTLTNEEIRNIAIQILQTLSNDTVMLGKINNIVQEMYGENIDTITSEDISTLINELSAQTIEEGNVIFTITKNDDMVNSISITTTNLTVELAKNQTESSLSYGIDVTQTDGIRLNIIMSYEGINTNNVSERVSAVINIPESINTTYTVTNNIVFGNAVTIEPFNNNVVILNNYSAEQLQPFIEQVGNIIAETNTSQMNQIGYRQEFINPIVMGVACPSIISAFEIVNNAMDSTINTNMQSELEQENVNEISTNMETYLNETLSTGNEINNISNMISEAENFIN